VGTRASLGVARLGHEANYSSPSSVEVKNEWSHTSASHIYLGVHNEKFNLVAFDIFYASEE
jgi:hypothetical protein